MTGEHGRHVVVLLAVPALDRQRLVGDRRRGAEQAQYAARARSRPISSSAVPWPLTSSRSPSTCWRRTPEAAAEQLAGHPVGCRAAPGGRWSRARRDRGRRSPPARPALGQLRVPCLRSLMRRRATRKNCGRPRSSASRSATARPARLPSGAGSAPRCAGRAGCMRCADVRGLDALLRVDEVDLRAPRGARHARGRGTAERGSRRGGSCPGRRPRRRSAPPRTIAAAVPSSAQPVATIATAADSEHRDENVTQCRVVAVQRLGVPAVQSAAHEEARVAGGRERDLRQRVRRLKNVRTNGPPQTYDGTAPVADAGGGDRESIRWRCPKSSSGPSRGPAGAPGR